MKRFVMKAFDHVRPFVFDGPNYNVHEKRQSATLKWPMINGATGEHWSVWPTNSVEQNDPQTIRRRIVDDP